MQITVEYEAQARRAVGLPSEQFQVEADSDVAACLRLVADRHPESLRQILLDAAGSVQSGLLVFVNDQQVVDAESYALSDGDTLTVMPPISGG